MELSEKDKNPHSTNFMDIEIILDKLLNILKCKIPDQAVVKCSK